MRRILCAGALALPLLAGPTNLRAQPADPSAPKLTLKADQAFLYESNPLSSATGARSAWSRTTVFGASLEVPLPGNVTWSATAQAKYWRYFKFHTYDDNEVTAGSALTAKFGPASLGLRYSHFGSYDRSFDQRYELRDDFALFANWRFEDKARGFSATPAISLVERRDNDHALDRRRINLSLPVLQKFGAFAVSGRLGATWDIYRRCLTNPCRRDLRFYAEAGLAYEISKQAELALAVDFERSISNLDGKGFSGLTIAPKLGLSIAF